MVRLRGFKEQGRERFWEWAVVNNRAKLTAMAEESGRRMRDEGITILTLADDPDPERYRKLWRMSDEAEQDIPSTVPHIGTPWETFEERMRSPGLREDRQRIAREGDGIVGVSQLSYPPLPGHLETDWTVTARQGRGRRRARAPELASAMEASP